MISASPKLRTDLVVSRQQTSAGVCFVIKDPVSTTFFRFGETEHFIALQLDGQTSLQTVRERTEKYFDAALSPAILDAFIKSLEKGNLLDTGKSPAKHKSETKRISGNPLYLRFRIFDPDRLFDRLAPRIQFFFTPTFLLLCAACILCGASVAVTNWSEYVEDLPRLYHFSAIPVFLGLSFLVVSLHEFAHGLTCKHFGGEVHEIGFFLVYFQPAMYCNVSDAWLFPERSKRLWVGFAGPYFELFLWSLATLTWRVTEADTLINYLGLIVMTSSGLKTLLNFNPFIKLDGYYLLSDYLEIPNLRKKSFAYVGSKIKKIFGFDSRLSDDISVRERRIRLVYGLVASFSSFVLLAYLLGTAGASLTEGRQPTAMLLSLFLLFMKFRRRFRRLFGKSSDTLEEELT
jgi:putative peptide zinc metalloprotease protein